MDFTRFLLNAKAATYAGQGDLATQTPLLPDAKQLEYREGDLLYRDLYVGMFHFVGQEIVYQNQDAIWSMSYSGGMLANVATEQSGAIYAHLRKALLAAPEAKPIRGPALLQEGQLCYRCEIKGGLDRFHGTEQIELADQLVYELHFAGGDLI